MACDSKDLGGNEKPPYFTRGGHLMGGNLRGMPALDRVSGAVWQPSPVRRCRCSQAPPRHCQRQRAAVPAASSTAAAAAINLEDRANKMGKIEHFFKALFHAPQPSPSPQWFLKEDG